MSTKPDKFPSRLRSFSLSYRTYWNRNGEAGTGAAPALDAEVAAVVAGDLARDAQAQAEAGSVGMQRLLGPVEAVKDAAERVVRNAGKGRRGGVLRKQGWLFALFPPGSNQVAFSPFSPL